MSEEGQLDERLILRHGDVGTVLGRLICIVMIPDTDRVFTVFVDGEPSLPEDVMLKAGMSRLGYCTVVRGTHFKTVEELLEQIENKFFSHINEGLYETYAQWDNPGGAAEPGGNGRGQ